MSETASLNLPEHQSVENNKDATVAQGYVPSGEEKKLLSRGLKVFEKNKRHRAQHDAKWPQFVNYWRGKQWKEARPSYRHSEVINFTFQTIQSQVPILTDAKQRIEFVAQEPSDTEFAKILDEVAEADWTSGNWTYKLAEMLYDAAIIGTGIGGLSYNPKARYGEGAIEFESVDPFYCFPDPNARDVNVKSKNFVIAEPEDLATLKADYPEKGKYVKPDLLDLLRADRKDLEPLRLKSPVDNRTILDGASSYDPVDNDKALKITVYEFDDEIEEQEKPALDEMGQPVVDPMTGAPQVTFVQKKKYPYGRKYVIAGGVVLSDGPMDLEDGLFPFIRFANYIDPRCFWGIGDVEQIEGPQNIFNKVYSFVLDVLTLMGNPIWVVDTNSEVDTDNLFNRPGLVVEKAQGSEVRREEGVQLQPYVLQILDRVQDYIKNISGAQDVSQGAKPEGVTAASAIAQLQEAAQTRIRQKARNLDATLGDFGKIWKCYALTRYDAPRVFRLTNQEGANKYFKFHVETAYDEQGLPQRTARVRQFMQDPATGAYAESPEEKEFKIRGDFDVKVITGSSLPFAKEAEFNKAMAMYEAGIVDEEEVLKRSEYPNWQAILERMQMKKQQEAEMALAAEGAGGASSAAPSAPPPPAA